MQLLEPTSVEKGWILDAETPGKFCSTVPAASIYTKALEPHHFSQPAPVATALLLTCQRRTQLETRTSRRARTLEKKSSGKWE